MISKRGISVLFCLLALSAALYALDHDAEISFLYSREAASLYRSGELDAALSCIQTALEFDEANSDALYLKGIIERETKGRAGAGGDSMTQALAAGNWREYGSSEALREAFRSLVEAERFDEALELMDREALGLYGDPGLFYLYIIALEAVDAEGEALDIARFAADTFEDEPRFTAVLVRLDGDVRDRIADDLLSGKGSTLSLPVLAQVTLSSDDPEVRKKAVEQYIRSGGKDPAVKIEMIPFMRRVSSETLNELVADGLFNKRSTLDTLLEYLQTEEQKNALRRLFEGFTGMMITGRENGFTVKSRYEKGTLVTIEAANRRSTVFLTVTFENGRPATVKRQEGETLYTYTYDGYPLVSSLEIFRPDEKRLFLFDGSLGMEILDDGVPGYPMYRFFPDNTVVDAETRQSRAKRIVIMRGEDYLSDLSRTSSSGAVIRESLRDTMDRTIVLAEGSPVRGAADTDQDGRYETVLEYDNGRVVRILYDGNGNGMYEYIYYPGDAAREEWDFDEDGRVDTREYILDGRRYLEYDNDGDGEFMIYVREGDAWRTQE